MILLKEEWFRGYEDYQKKKSISQNPFSKKKQLDKWKSWNLGWEDGQQNSGPNLK